MTRAAAAVAVPGKVCGAAIALLPMPRYKYPRGAAATEIAATRPPAWPRVLRILGIGSKAARTPISVGRIKSFGDRRRRTSLVRRTTRWHELGWRRHEILVLAAGRWT